MRSSRRASILRRLARLTVLARNAVVKRQTLREKAGAWTVIRAALSGAGINPARIKILWPLAEAAGALARLGDPSGQERADAAFIAADPILRSRLPYAAGVAARVARFRGGRPPPRDAALFDWYAWALAQSDTR